MLSIEEQGTFLTKYKAWTLLNKIPQQKRIDIFNDLVNRFKQYHADYEINARTNASDFNIFDILWVSSDEVRHSAFLRELLDPEGSHGQGKLFLSAFIEKCAEHSASSDIYQQILSAIDEGKWTVWREHSTSSFGRMDVVLINPILGVLIVIENKIYAYEQRNQIINYGRWMKSIESEFPLQGLIFLTPSGYQSSTADGFPYNTLSYKKDIAGWLHDILPQIEAPVVRSTIEQYTKLVRRL